MASVASDRALEQRRAAIVRANEVRSARANVKRQLRAGVLTIGEAFDVRECEGAEVWDLLMAVPGWGRTKVRKLLAHAGVSASKRVDGLTPRQRLVVLEIVEARRRAR